MRQDGFITIICITIIIIHLAAKFADAQYYLFPAHIKPTL